MKLFCQRIFVYYRNKLLNIEEFGRSSASRDKSTQDISSHSNMTPNLHELLHPKGFSAALWPYRFLAIIFGHCNAASKKLRAIYAVVMVSASLLLSYFVGPGLYEFVAHDKGSDMEVAIAYFGSWFQVILTPMHVLTWFFVGHSSYTEVVASLTLVDRELEKLCRRQVNFRMAVIRQLVCISLIVLFLIILVVCHRSSDFMGMNLWLFLAYCYACYCGTITLVMMSFFGNFVCFTGHRYALINSALNRIGSNVEKESAAGNLSRVIFDEVNLTRELRAVHRRLYFVSRRIMDAFSIQMLASVLYSFIFTVYGLYSQYKAGTSPSGNWTMNRILTCVIGVLFNFSGIIYIGYCCHETVREANGTTKILNTLKTSSEDLRLEVSSFSYQLMHYQLDFSPFGLYQLDLTLVQSMIASITTYFVILVQMKPVSSDRESLTNTTA